jgi:hypothetical protein
MVNIPCCQTDTEALLTVYTIAEGSDTLQNMCILLCSVVYCRTLSAYKTVCRSTLSGSVLLVPSGRAP